ncbi:MAG: outer membrane beta-barrel protein [Flavobacteriales bacterium]
MLKQLSIIAITLLATHAHSALSQPFVTFGSGQSNYISADDFCKKRPQLSCEDTDSAFRISAGVGLWPMYAAEFTYLNHGEASAKGVVDRTNQVENYIINAESFALQLSGTANVIAQLSVYGKAGIALTKADASYHAAGIINGIQITKNEDSHAFGGILTVGAQYAVLPNIMLELQADYLPNAINLKEIEFKTGLTQVSAGLKYQF